MALASGDQRLPQKKTKTQVTQNTKMVKEGI